MSFANWRGLDDYPAPNAPPRRWAWEFLRRNADYQRDFKRVEVEPRPGRVLITKAEIHRHIERGLGTTPDAFNPRDLAALMRGDLLSPLLEGLERKWGLCPLANPARSEAWRHFAFTVERITYIAPGNTLPTSTRSAKIGIVFDLDLPIKAQLARAEAALARWASLHEREIIKRRDDLDKFATYLRILDARAERVTVPAIADWFSREDAGGWDESRVRKAAKRARELSADGYRLIAARAVPVKGRTRRSTGK